MADLPECCAKCDHMDKGKCWLWAREGFGFARHIVDVNGERPDWCPLEREVSNG